MGARVFCQGCGDAIAADDVFCGNCGAQQDVAPPVPRSAIPAPAQMAHAAVATQAVTSPILAPVVRPGAGTMWLRRLATWLIDGFAIAVPTTILSYVLMFAIISQVSVSNLGTVITALMALNFLPFVAYCAYVAMTMSRGGKHNGQTWGRRACALRVVRQNGNPMSVGWTLLREILVKSLFGLLGFVLALIISVVKVDGLTLLCLVLPILIDCLWPLWDEHGEALHDKLAGTSVIDA